MNEVSGSMLAVAVAWVALVVACVRLTIRSRHGSIGLPAAYLFATTFLYCGAWVYAFPGYHHLRVGGSDYLAGYNFTEYTVLAGAVSSLTGICGFVIGCGIAGLRRVPRVRLRPARPLGRTARLRVMAALACVGAIGFLFAFVYIPIPLAQAIRQVGQNGAVVFVCLGAFLAVHVDGQPTYLRWVLLASCIAASYLVFWGFVSYGFEVFTICAGFWLAVLASPRIGAFRVAVGSALIFVLSLSLFVAYMSARTELRSVLWTNTSSFAERVSKITEALGETEILWPSNRTGLDWLNVRLNQSIFVGKAIEWHEANPDLRLNGETLMLIPVAWMPRFLWPDKPELGGSRFVSTHTGMTLSESTTFGSGPVFDYYVNFGPWGVFFGFVVLGGLLRSIDIRGAAALRSRSFLDFARWFAVGIAFVSPQRDVFFVANTAFASWIMYSALKLALGMEPSGRRRRPTAPSPPHFAQQEGGMPRNVRSGSVPKPEAGIGGAR